MPNLTGIQSLKMIASRPDSETNGQPFPGLEDLKARGWRELETLRPSDGRTYVLLGLPAETDAAKIARLEAEVIALRAAKQKE